MAQNYLGDRRKTEWENETLRTYPTVGTICATTLLRSLVDLNVLDDKSAGVKTFGVRVGFGVFEQAQKEFSRFDGPSGA